MSQFPRKSCLTSPCSEADLLNDSVIALSDFLDYYFQTLGYLASRKERRANFDEDTKSRKVSVVLERVFFKFVDAKHPAMSRA